MCQLMDVVRTMLDASYRESKMEGARGEEPVPHPMEFFFDNWPNFAEAQLSSLLRMSVLGHFMRICGVQSITLDEFKKFHTTAVELSDCDIAYFMVQAIRSVKRNENDKCSSAEERVNNTRLMFCGEKGEVFRQFKVECACIEGERLAFMIELLERLSGTTLENMKNKGSLTFQSLMERIERAKNEKVLLTNRQEKEKEEKEEEEKDEEKEEEEKKEEEEEKKKEKDLMAYSMSVFFEVCTSDVTWPPSPEDPENSEDPDAPEYPEVPAAVAAAAE